MTRPRTKQKAEEEVFNNVKEFWVSDIGFKIIEDYAREKCTLTQICDKIDVPEPDFLDWLKESAELRHVIYKSTYGDPAKVAEKGLYRLAEGFFRTETTIHKEIEGGREVVVSVVKKIIEVPSDFKACTFILTNQMGEKYRHNAAVSVMEDTTVKKLVERWNEIKALDDEEELLINEGQNGHAARTNNIKQ